MFEIGLETNRVKWAKSSFQSDRCAAAAEEERGVLGLIQSKGDVRQERAAAAAQLGVNCREDGVISINLRHAFHRTEESVFICVTKGRIKNPNDIYTPRTLHTEIKVELELVELEPVELQ
jgi:hypothetical protein